MFRIITKYGSVSGLIVILTMILGHVLSGSEGFFAGAVFGYLVMLVALSMIFLGVKAYRDQELGGVIRFWPALAVGVGIAAVAGVAYVVAWEVYLAMTDYAFASEYTAGLIEQKRAAGLSEEALAAEIERLRAFEQQYLNPLFRIPITFTEILPVGLIIALISAAVLRNPKVLPAQQPA